MTDNSTNDVPAEARVRLLVWDDLDIRARTADVLVGDGPADMDADLERVFLWLLGRCAPGEAAEACLFTAVRPGEEDAHTPAVTKARLQGFAVLAKIQPTLGRADLSTAMWAHIDQLAATGTMAEVIVASHDAAAFGARLAALADRGPAVTIVGFRERAGFAAGRVGIGFVDLESIPGVFAGPLPRTNLFDLPTEGRVLPPLHRPALPALDAGPRLVAVPRVLDTPADTDAATATATAPSPTLTSVNAPPATKPLSSLLVPSSMSSGSVLGSSGSGGGGSTPAATTPSVIDLSTDDGAEPRPSVFDAPPAPLVEGAPPPPPPPPWRPGAATLPSGSAEAPPAPPTPDGMPPRPGRVMPPDHG